ncbi:hypothetical protein PENSTE_c015G06973 [Penicillium steckii]|uniref:Telomeric single stranded DNA binding POT1/Cdc13 domain-containing protein n=1 Tax=Penicillium steckii TaxID=303698 RepID=A0A1V6T190_9EURO|nr:hypothetical protein PENSTE_c015G06973 [Penicillium steckii]
MMDATEESSPNARPSLTKIPIAQLSPTLEQAKEKCISATVTLVWPYSSSTKTFALLLAEPDFRLRRSNGQVKVVFHGRVAEKVAGSLVGIGDNVNLALNGLEFVEISAATQTPGRSIAWDVHFNNRGSLEIKYSRDQSIAHIDDSPSEAHEAELPLPSTPRVASTNPDNALVANGLGAWGSPAFLRSARSSYGEILDSAYDPFTEEDGFVPGKGRKRPRYSLQREDWRLVNESESPRDREEVVDWDAALDEYEDKDSDQVSQPISNGQPEKASSDHEISKPEKSTTMDDPFIETSGVFAKPSLQFTSGLFGQRAMSASQTSGGGPFENNSATPAMHLPTDTPRLQPIPSPGLPIPSPIVSNQNNAQGYFSPLHVVPQAEDAQSLSVDVNIDATNQGQQDQSLEEQTQTTHMVEENILNEEYEKTHSHVEPAIQIEENELPETHVGMPTDALGIFDSVVHQLPGEPEDITSGFETEHLSEIDGSRAAGKSQDQPIRTENFSVMEEATIEEFPPIITAGTMSASSANDAALQELNRHNEVEDNLMEDQPGKHLSVDDENEDRDSSAASDYSEHSASRDYYGEESSAEESDIEDDFADDGVGDDSRDGYYDEDDDENDYEVYSEEDEENEESLAQDLPRPQPSQQEIIVLDSDSEDEPAAPPQSQLSDHGQGPPPERDQPSMDEMDGEEDWSADEDEARYDEVESAESEDDGHQHFHQDDRVDESDLNDESSVKSIVQDHHIDQRSTGEGSIGPQDRHEIDQSSSEEEEAEEIEEIEAIEDGTDAEDVESEHYDELDMVERSGSDDDRDSNTDSNMDEAEEESKGLPVDPEAASELDQRTVHYGFDGTSDHHTPPPSSFIEPSHEISKYEDSKSMDGEVEEVELESAVDTQFDGDLQPVEDLQALSNAASHQLLTPDPTQEAMTAPEPILLPNETTNVPPENTQALPAELNVPIPPAFDFSPRAAKSIEEDEEEEAPFVADLDLVPSSKEENHEMSEAPKVLVPEIREPDRHAPGLRSKLSYFAPLATLIDHYNALVDTISIVHETTPIAKATSGSKDFFITIQLTDPSMAGTTLQAQIFRRRKSVFPSIVPGNALLLRDFKVRTYDHSFILVSVESSSWAVFDGNSSEVEMNGPPVEYALEEEAFASDLRTWYDEIGSGMLADSELQAAIERDSIGREGSPGSVVPSEAGSFESGSRENSILSSRGLRRSRNSHRRVTIHELRDGTRYTEVGSPSTRDSIHELRDGTVYATR